VKRQADDIEMVPIGSLKFDPENARGHDERNLSAIRVSIAEHGIVSPVVVDKRTRIIIGGNATTQVATEMGATDIGVSWVDCENATERRKLAVRLNRTGELATWKPDQLGAQLAEWQAVEGVDWDPEAYGFDPDEASGFVSAFEGPSPVESIEPIDPDDDLDELPDEVPAITRPGEVVELGRHRLHCGDCIEVMRSMPDASVTAIVTDPPYGLGFMGKAWDALPPGEEWARECLRVLVPGGHVVAFGGTRTVHRLACALEDAGLEIRDTVAWVQWQGFPKSLDVSKALDQHHGAEREVVGNRPQSGAKFKLTQRTIDNGGFNDPARESFSITAPATDDARTWDGFGTALKPSIEPAILARKPLVGTVAENVLAHGAGALNIDGCRYAYGDPAWPGPGDHNKPVPVKHGKPIPRQTFGKFAGDAGAEMSFGTTHDLGRWPANIYACPKASRSEREAGCEVMAPQYLATMGGGIGAREHHTDQPSAWVGNHHPTVKPSRLMRWLVRLVGCQPGSVILDPFLGSGTTLVAGHVEGFTMIGIEREPEYCDIARARWAAVECAR